MQILKIIEIRDKAIGILSGFGIEINKIDAKNIFHQNNTPDTSTTVSQFIISLGGINKIIFNKDKDKIISILEKEIKNIKFIFK